MSKQDVELLESFRAAWGLFRAIEGDADESPEELIEQRLSQWDPVQLINGLLMVASCIRVDLVEHATKCGCSSGSDEWLDREVAKAAVFNPFDEKEER